MLEARLFAALAAEHLVVTPNRRLARGIAAHWDARQREAGRSTWKAARVLPWSALLDELWHDAIARDDAAAIGNRLRPPAAAWRWERIVAADGTVPFDPRGAATLAADAWSLLHAWGEGGQSWRAWRRDGDDDPSVFARWAERFHAQLADARAIDDASLADVLSRAASAGGPSLAHDIVLAGFLELSAQQERLLAALTRAGVRIVRTPTLAQTPSRVVVASAATPRDEIVQALTWARAAALDDPAATIGIAVADLAATKEEVRALAEDVLCPALQFPGRESEPRPYNVSLGDPLSSVPIVAAALDLIELLHGALPAARAATTLRTAYLPDAARAWSRRAMIERPWLDDGVRDVTLDVAIDALARFDPPLCARLRRARDRQRSAAHATPREWIERWSQALDGIGWPGDRTLDSGEQQARSAWDRLLLDFASLGAVAERLTRGEAMAALRALAAARVFQPETVAARVQIVGLLEAAGLPFDALWVARFSAERWPPAPQPNPFLPIAWQRERDVPRSSAARELRYARALTDQLVRGVGTVVLSCARTVEDHPSALSSLALEIEHSVMAPMASAPSQARAVYACRPALECVADAVAPPIPRRPACARRRETVRESERVSVQGGRREAVEGARVAARGSGSVGDRARQRRACADARVLDRRARPCDARRPRRHGARATCRSRCDGRARRARAFPPARSRAGDCRRRAAASGGAPSRMDRALRKESAAVRRHRDGGGSRGRAGGIDVRHAPRPRRSHRRRHRRARLQDRVRAGVRVLVRATPARAATRPLCDRASTSCRARRAGARRRLRSAQAGRDQGAGCRGVAGGLACARRCAAVARRRLERFEAWWRAELERLAADIRDGAASVDPRDGDKTCKRCHLAALCRIRATVPAREDRGDE